VLSRPGKYAAIQLLDDRSLLVRQQTRNSFLWTFDTRSGGTKQLSFGVDVDEGDRGVSWTPDDRILYTAAYATGRSAGIWIRDEDGSDKKRLTSPPPGAWDCNPHATADGRYIVFDRHDPSSALPWSIRRLSRSGGPEIVLLEAREKLWLPVSTPDSRSVYFWRGEAREFGETRSGSPPETWRMSIDGTGAELVARDCGFGGLDRSATRILCFDFDEGRVIPIGGGPPEWKGSLGWPADFTPLGELGFVINPGGRNVEVEPLDGTARQSLTHFSELQTQLLDFAWSRDGRKLVLSRNHRSVDLLLMENLP
jgi:hypothetical protein